MPPPTSLSVSLPAPWSDCPWLQPTLVDQARLAYMAHVGATTFQGPNKPHVPLHPLDRAAAKAQFMEEMRQPVPRGRRPVSCQPVAPNQPWCSDQIPDSTPRRLRFQGNIKPVNPMRPSASQHQAQRGNEFMKQGKVAPSPRRAGTSMRSYCPPDKPWLKPIPPPTMIAYSWSGPKVGGPHRGLQPQEKDQMKTMGNGYLTSCGRVSPQKER